MRALSIQSACARCTTWCKQRRISARWVSMIPTLNPPKGKTWYLRRILVTNSRHKKPRRDINMLLSVRLSPRYTYKKYTESAILIKAASAHDIKHINKSKLQHATKWNAQIRKMRPFPFFTLFLLSWIGWNPHHRFWLPLNSDGYRAKPSQVWGGGLKKCSNPILDPLKWIRYIKEFNCEVNSIHEQNRWHNPCVCQQVDTPYQRSK